MTIMNDYQAWLESGKKALQEGRMSEARRLLTGAVQANPQSDEGWLYLAATLPPQRAYEALGRALQINPDNEQARRGYEKLQQQIKPAPSDEVEALFGEIEGKPVSRSRLQSPTVKEITQNNLPFASEDEDSVRKILTQPYLRRSREAEKKKARRKRYFLFAELIGLIIIGGVVFMIISANQPTNTVVTNKNETATSEVALVNTPLVLPSPTTTEAITLPPATPTIQPRPTVPPNLNRKTVLNERGELKGIAITFFNYDNRSANFAFTGGGSPTPGKHFEGVLVEVENIYNKVLPIDNTLFQAIDSRNGFLAPVGNGRIPALDIVRLLPSEKRQCWLTFEVEDGTSLRRVVYTPVVSPDDGNSAEVNLVLPPATPAPSVGPTRTPAPTLIPTPRPTATAVPTVAPSPTPRPTTVAPTATFSPVVVETQIVALNTATSLPTATAIPTPTPAPTATAEPIATTAAAAATIQATTTVAPTPLPSPTPLTKVGFNLRYVLGNLALTVSQYQPTITAKPPVLPIGYHYEAVKITVENIGTADVSEFLKSVPFYLRDSNGFVYTVGPYNLEAKDRFDAFQFATTSKGAGKTKVTGLLYFLVSDRAKSLPLTLVFFGSSEADSPIASFDLK